MICMLVAFRPIALLGTAALVVGLSMQPQPAMSRQLRSAAPKPATFEPPTQYPLSAQGTAFDLASGDFTGTGVKDIVVADGAAGAVSLLANHGDGTFAPAVTVHAERGRSITTIAAGDFTNAGQDDIVIVSEGTAGKQDLVLLRGDGKRHFMTSARMPLQDLGQTSPLLHAGFRSVAIGTFTRAGLLDAAITEGVNYVSVFSGDGKGGFTGRRDLLAAALPVSIIGTNLFSQGLMDLGIVDNDSSSVYTFANRGNGTFKPRQLAPLGILPINAQPVSLASGDFRNDGRADLFAVYSSTEGSCNCVGRVLLSDGNGTYASAVDVPIGGHVDFPEAGSVADFDGDGVADLGVVAEHVGTPNTNVVLVLPGNGDGTFSTASQTTVTVPPPAQGGIALADKMIVDDFKGDGKPSIAFSFDRSTGWGVAVLINTTR